MKQSDDMKKTLALVALAENFGKSFSEGLLSMWLDLLSGYSPEQVVNACREVVETYAFKTLPPFAVLKRCLDGHGGSSLEDLQSLRAREEWALLLERTQSLGRDREPSHHPTTAAILRTLGGWQAACSWTESELPFRRKDFLSLWPVLDNQLSRSGQPGRALENSPSRELPFPPQLSPTTDPDAVSLPAPCSQCGGSGWIVGYSSSCPTGTAFPCVCRKDGENIRRWTRAELSIRGFSFDPPRMSSGASLSSRKWEERGRRFFENLNSPAS